MSKQTKIVVLKSKELIYTGIFLVLGILFILLVFYLFAPPKKHNTTNPYATHTDATSAVETISRDILGSYTKTISFAGIPLDLTVSFDSSGICKISIDNMSDQIKELYPLLESSVSEINRQLENGIPIDKITYSQDNKYTVIILLDEANKLYSNSKE